MTPERHPLHPYLPEGTRLLMLGSFPPARKRWCMDFFYPNFQNDMWRIFGLCFYGDALHFVDSERKTFRREAIEQLLSERGIGLYDTAEEVIRVRQTASDKDLQVVTATNLRQLLRRVPGCQAVCTTGQKATSLFADHFQLEPPRVGSSASFAFDGRTLRLYRMPSSSRAYPMKLERKAETYLGMFRETGLAPLPIAGNPSSPQ